MTTTQPQPTRIVRITAVRDTRDRIEVGDRFVAIPGTGAIRACDRCGRDHEIHVDVELEDGRTACIGQGCAKGESVEVVAAIKSAISAAKTRSKLAAELAAERAELARAEAAWLEVEALELPAVTQAQDVVTEHGRAMRVYQMGDATVWTLPGGEFDAERRGALERGWRRGRYRERGFTSEPYLHRARVAELEGRLEKIERKIAKLTVAS